MIRTPMNAIIGMSHLALKTEMTPRQRDYIKKTFMSKADDPAALIAQFSDYATRVRREGILSLEAHLRFSRAEILPFWNQRMLSMYSRSAAPMRISSSPDALMDLMASSSRGASSFLF